MLAFSIIGILVLIIIFLVFKIQMLNRQITQSKSLAKQHSQNANYAYLNLSVTAKSLQSIFLQRLETAANKGLISEKDKAVLFLILSSSSKIVFENCEKHRSIEEGLTLALRNSELTMEDIKAYMQEQPNDVRMSWVQNSADGFVRACDLMTNGLMQPRATKEQAS